MSVQDLAAKRNGLTIETGKLLSLSWADLNTFLLGLYEKRVRKIKHSDLLANYTSNTFLRVSDADPRKINRMENLLFDTLPPDYKIVDIAPVSPIGVNTVLAKISSKTSLSTIRNIEVLSDPTTQLALEAARIRVLHKDIDNVNLASACRLLRTQKFDPASGMTNHFKAFALVTSGKNTGDRIFEYTSMFSQIKIWLDFFKKSENLGYKPKNISVAISNISIINELCKAKIIDKKNVVESIRYNKISIFEKNSVRLARESDDITELSDIPYEFLQNPIETLKRAELDFVKNLREIYPDVKFYYRLDRIAGSTFYSGLCFKIYAVAPDDNKHALVDGGVSDWNKKILQNNKEMVFTSGFGSELYSKFFD